MFWLSQNGSQMFCPQKISEKWEIKVCEASSVPACAPPHAVCCSVALLAVQHLCVSPGCDVCQWFHYARTFSLGSVPGYPPAGNCVSLSCLLLGLFWLFDLFVCFFVLSSDLQLVQIMLAADDCRKEKEIKTQKKKKKGPPQTKRLKKQTNKKPNPCAQEWRGSYCLGGSWNLLHSV